MHKIGHSKPMRWDNSAGWDRERVGRGLQDGGTHEWLIHITV